MNRIWSRVSVTSAPATVRTTMRDASSEMTVAYSFDPSRSSISTTEGTELRGSCACAADGCNAASVAVRARAARVDRIVASKRTILLRAAGVVREGREKGEDTAQRQTLVVAKHRTRCDRQGMAGAGRRQAGIAQRDCRRTC